jgi:glycosyltransferase involved in cell wall biosynthesis
MNKVLVCKAELLHPSETFVREQVLAYRDWQATMVGKRRVPGLSLDGLPVELIGRQSEGRIAKLRERVLRKLDMADPADVRRLARLKASLAHVHFGTDAVELWPVLRKLGLPVAVTLHGYDIMSHAAYWASGAGGWTRIRYPDRLVEMARSPHVHVIAVSEAIRQRAIEFGLPAERMRVQYIGIDPVAFQSGGPPLSQRRKKILHVGRLVEKKGVAHLINAFARVRSRIPDAELTIVGDGPLQKDLIALAGRLNVPVEFAGSMGRDGIKAHLDNSRLFCLASVRAESGDAEGFGIVLLEAQAAGVPVITSALGGAQEGVIDGVTGLPFAEGDVDALTEHLTGLLADDERLDRMSVAARDFVAKRFDIRVCTRELEKTYAEIAGAGQRN